MYRQTVKIRHEGESETLNVHYDNEAANIFDEEFTTDSSSDSDENYVAGDTESGYVLTLSDNEKSSDLSSYEEVVRSKLSHLDQKYHDYVSGLLVSCLDVIASTIEKVRPSKV